MDATVAEVANDLGVDARSPAARAAMLVPVLREVQTRLGEVPVRLIPDIAAATGVAESRAFSVATFYPSFQLSGPDGGSRAGRAEPLIADILGVPLSSLPPICCRQPRHPSEVRRVIARCRCIDPSRIEDYCADGGYAGLEKARAMAPGDVIEAVLESGLRGRGGAGFPTARKWRAARDTASDARYLVCNAAEGDLGATMDRAVLQTDPHAVIEGLAIAAHAVGATHGFVFLRSEYAGLIPLLGRALGQAEERGYLGGGFRVEIVHAAGRYVCGEETALLNAVEGKPGRPRFRPPFPAQAGLWGKPTVINNVKTLAAVPLILRHGPAWFASVGTEQSRGTAALALAGHVANEGLVEVPMGTPLRHVIEDIGGGLRGGEALKAVQTGGPLGGLVPEPLLDTRVTFEDMAAIGSPLGSGGMIVIGEGTCMVAVARCFAEFCREESCGYCAPCRMGSARLARVVAAISEGRGRTDDLALLDETAHAMRHGSFCAFGQGAPGVLMSALTHFRDEFETHVRTGRCAAGTCRGFAAASSQPHAGAQV